ncbi:hypothetical protein [Legionella cincinnatiensis]|uniref:Uncharacterized protein n=1 Tax=Legionella cincinnatiensis TaxID=28085 RepID=A0A378IFU8_9GAMM|nr:hypothetical protein [Legionella cincinnatiensis]KTC93574.1 hypothetical protein Lcin_0154 [Legionella cincinnatiensis]STX34097.1 Uncharacterised protein [Legionella cincinnatiensis]
MKFPYHFIELTHTLDENSPFVRLGFAPKDCSSYEIIPIDEHERDEMLFVEAKKLCYSMKIS